MWGWLASGASPVPAWLAPHRAPSHPLFLGEVELEAVLLGGRHVQRLPLLRVEVERVGDEVDPLGRRLLVAGDELIDVGRRAPGLGGKIGLCHAGLGKRHAHRGPEWTGVS